MHPKNSIIELSFDFNMNQCIVFFDNWRESHSFSEFSKPKISSENFLVQLL